jgi:hypothetical protein
MKTRTGIVVAALLLAFASLSVAPSAQAQNARPRDVLALQQDLTDLDQTYNQLTVRQRQRFEARVSDVKNDVTNMRSRMNDLDWQNNVTRQELDDLRTRIATLQDEMDQAQTRRASRGNSYGAGLRIPAGTELDVRLDQTVSSRNSRVEERVEATVVSPVTVNGRTVIPTGSVVTGYVAEVDDADRAQRDGRIRLEFNGLQFPNGTRADIRSRVVNVETQHVGRSTARTAGLGAILGGVLGGVLGGGKGAIVGAVLGGGGAVVATRGQNVELPEGTHLVLRLDDATVLAQRE